MLLENSLYTNPVERDALVKDKKRVMDALCFSLFGFLGCYQLAQNRSFLKTYEQTEGQLRLSAIGDNNHDVSLSIKLAEEAGTIPQAAAMNVTKLLYKIKSKQIRGPLDEQLVRDTIKTLKISSHRPDNMVYSVVNQFEDGTISLGQLAHKLYNLSKVKQFQSVSGEFRQLVMKGQYQELFAKLPVNGNIVGTTITTNTSSVSAVPASASVVAPAPVVVSKKLQSGGFIDCPEDLLIPLFKQMVSERSWTSAVLRDNVLRFCKKNDIVIDLTTPSKSATDAAIYSLQKFMVERFNKKDYNWAGEFFGYPKWQISCTSNGYVTVGRIMYLNLYGRNRHLLEAGKLIEFNAAMGLEYPNGGLEGSYFIDDYNKEFLEDIIKPSVFWDALKENGAKLIYQMNQAALTIQKASGSIKTCKPAPHLDLSPEVWAMNSLVRMADAFSVYNAKYAWTTGYENMDLSAMFVTAFGLTGSNVNVKKSSTGSSIIIASNMDMFKNDSRLYNAVQELDRVGSIQFVDIADAYEAMKDQALKIGNATSKTSSGSRLWFALIQIANDAFGNTSIIHTEKFVEWLIDEIKSGKIPINVFDSRPNGDFYPESCRFYWNAFDAFSNKYTSSVTFNMWAETVSWATNNSDHLNDPNYETDLALIFKHSHLHFEAQDINSTLVNIGAFVARPTYSKIIQNMVDAAAAGWSVPTLSVNAWKLLLNYANPVVDTNFTKLWNFNDDVARELWISYQSLNWRPQLMRSFAGLRDQKLEHWLLRFEHRDSFVGAFQEFLRPNFGWALDEDMIKPNVLAFIKKCIPYIAEKQVLYSGLTTGHPLPDWLDKPVKEALHKQINASITMTSVSNARVLLDHKGFTDYVMQKSIQGFADNITVQNTTDATQLCDILNKIAHHPNDYGVQVLLRFAYAMHRNVKYIKEAGTASYANAAYESVCEALNSLMASGKVDDVNQIYDALSFAPDLRTKIVDWFRKSGVLKNALESVKDDVVHSLVPIDQKRMNQLMKFNNIKFPNIPRKAKDFKLSDVIKTHTTFDLEPLAITEDTLDEKALLRRTAEYDAFNKYRHGNIGIKFLRSFNVNIPSQIEANKIWNQAHPSSEYMDPVFHGTGSVAATFVLRYGFAVISATDSSVVGRMLGNGIYFSNVLDKAGQYISDGGYSRGKGNKGYLFQMRANLGTQDTDYKSQGQGLVSPEWCVFHPNEQLNIYKAHFVELVDKKDIDDIKSKVDLNESFFRVEQFKEHLNEGLQNPVQKGCISYTFMDGQIPITEDVVIDFEQFDPTAFGPHVTLESSGLGPVVYIEVDDPSVSEIYAIRYTVQFMSQVVDLHHFLDLLAKRAGS